MLHAEIHGKVSAGADDAERLEDVLTSTVFGTMLLVGAWDELLAWLGRARPFAGAAMKPDLASPERAYWFWPQLDDAEPDVLIRIGDVLFVVEAKYRSGKSAGGVDQLVREWRACCPEADQRAYPPALCDAIRSCRRVLVYLVSRERWGHEQRAIQVSATQAPDACMHLLTWEHLDEVLPGTSTPWSQELRAFLHRRGLSAFRGFGHLGASTVDMTRVARWRRGDPAPQGGLRTIVSAASLPLLRSLSSFGRPGATGPGRVAWPQVVSADALPGLAALAGRRSNFNARERAT